MVETNDRCIFSKCEREAFDEGFCEEHLKNKERVGDGSRAQSQVNAVEGVEQTVCKICACSPADAKPHFNKKHGQCQKHLTNAHNRKKAAEKKAAKKEEKEISSTIYKCPVKGCDNKRLDGYKDCLKHCLDSHCNEAIYQIGLCRRHFEELPPELELTEIKLDLADYPKVLENVKDLAKEQIRSIPHQIIFILKDYFEVAEELSGDGDRLKVFSKEDTEELKQKEANHDNS